MKTALAFALNYLATQASHKSPYLLARADGIAHLLQGIYQLATGRDCDLTLEWVFSKERREMEKRFKKLTNL